MPLNTVKVDRTSLFGNPFKIGDWGQAGAVEAFRLYITHHYCGKSTAVFAHELLRGKNLACWCKPGALCHADVLLEIANK